MSARAHAGVVGAALAVLLLLIAAGPQPAPPTRSVPLYVSVEDDGRLIQGLTAAQFRVYEDNVARPFRVEPAEAPASIVLLVENSDTARRLFADEIRSGVEGFAAAAPETHWYALASFAHTVNVDLDFTRLPGRLTTALGDLALTTWNESDVRDAVYEMLDRMDRLGGRRVLIVLASGIDSTSHHSRGDLQRKLETTDVVVFAVGLGAELRGLYEPYWDEPVHDAVVEGEMFLRSLATTSGGGAVFPMFSHAFGGALEDVAKEIACQYRIVYESSAPSDGALHKVKIEAFLPTDGRQRALTVHCRTGRRF